MTRPTNSLNDKLEPELVGDARNGDRDAMAELFRRQYPRSIAIAHRILRARRFFGCCSVGLSFCLLTLPIVPWRSAFRGLDYTNCPKPVPDASARAGPAARSDESRSTWTRRYFAHHYCGFTHAGEASAAIRAKQGRRRCHCQAPKAAK
jgi:hypothetical protein